MKERTDHTIQTPPPADTVVHRFNVLAYGGNNVVSVVVCDCGWCDITAGHEIGDGWDAACTYAVHMGHPDPRDLAEERTAKRLAHNDGEADG